MSICTKAFSNNSSILHTKWHLSVKRPAYLLDASLILASDVIELRETIGVSYSRAFVILEDGQGRYYIPDKEVQLQIELLKKNLKKTKMCISRLPNIHTQLKKNLQIIMGTDMYDDHLHAYFTCFFEAYRKFISYRVVTRILGYHDDMPKIFIHNTARMRMRFKCSWTEIRNELEKVWSQMAYKFHVSKTNIKSLTYKELLQYLKEKRHTIALNPINARNKQLILYRTPTIECILTMDETQSIIQNIDGGIDTTANSVRGTIAYKGTVRGKVKLIFNPKSQKINAPCVLVTPMTTPDFVPLLKNIKAIITDEGGLTCHAAIISREFHIPCLTGTKYATKIFKNNDYVEVDAYNGIVNLLK